MVSDRLILEFDRALRTVFTGARSQRPIPGGQLPETELSEQERTHAAGLMRVNHVGEICAQALYQGQAITSRNPALREALRGAADEETEHLAWTERRIAELGGRKSLLNPLWYLGALSIGLVAGRCGDRWNLGFLAERNGRSRPIWTAIWNRCRNTTRDRVKSSIRCASTRSGMRRRPCIWALPTCRHRSRQP